jgi:hypothetical protein
MKPHLTPLSLLVAALLTTGCIAEASPNVEERVEEDAQALIYHNAFALNGTRLNGIRLNGIRLNGIRLNGIQLNGTQLAGTRESDGAVLSRDDLAGSAMTATLLNGTMAELHIDAVDEDALPGIDLYTVSIFDGGTTVSACGYDAQGSPIRALPLAGLWDYQNGAHIDDPAQLTLACDGAVLAKCARWGYAPWIDRTECDAQGHCQTVPGRVMHDACTRMVRADYCGDGVPHTRDGTTIDVWDAVGYLAETPGSGLLLEAEWSPAGAVCVAHTRWSRLDGTNPHQDYILANCPSRWWGPGGSCGGAGSTFFAANGFGAPLATRALLRNASGQNRE